MNFFLLLLFVMFANAGEWKNSEHDFKFLKKKIYFNNRASCAKKSKLPATSVFLIVDNVNMAKAVYRIAKKRNMDTVATTDHAIEKFRYTVTKLVQLIGDRLLNGSLPLIYENNISDNKIKENWIKSSRGNQIKNIQCKEVVKFTSLFSYLNVSKPDRFLLEQIAKDQINFEDSFKECNSFSDVKRADVNLYQFQFEPTVNFNKIGFQFWSSLKIYLSWAFRNSNEMTELSSPFDYVFKSADLEEMVLFFNNGCETISPLECSENYLGIENLKHLTTATESLDFSESDLVRPIPDNPTDHFFSKPLPLLDDDFLNLEDFKTSSEWVSNFRGNFLKVRGYQKIRLHKAYSFLNLISSTISFDQIKNKILKESLYNDIRYRSDFYYLCSEYNLVSDNNYGPLKNEVESLLTRSSIKHHFQELYASDFHKSYALFMQVQKEIQQICNNFERIDYWQFEQEIKRDGFASWYLQFTQQDKFTFNERSITSSIESVDPFLKIQDNEIICHTGIQCARKMLDSMMTLSSISQSFSALDSNDSIISGNISNPYSSYVACGVYDPWRKKNKILFDFLHDLTQAAAFGLLPSPVYVSAELAPHIPVSFASLIQDGKVFFDPKYDKKKIKFSLISDLGPLIGLPCSLSITGSRLNALEYYAFNGISFSGCRDRTKHELDVYSAEDTLQNSSYLKTCGTCAINLQTILSSASLFRPVLRMSAFLVKGVLRLANHIKDPHDFSRNWELSLHKLALNYRYHGSITEKCSRKLLKGENCFPKKCEGDILEKFTEKYSVSPVRSDFNCLNKTGIVFIKECDTPIHLKFHSKLIHKTDCDLKLR